MDSRTTLRLALLVAITLTFLAGAVSFVIGVTTSAPSFLAFAAGRIPASIASGAALLGVQTWADARASALDAKSREALELLIGRSVAVIGSGLNLTQVDLPMRASIATWGSPALLGKLAERTMLIELIAVESEQDVRRQRDAIGDPNATVTVEIGDRKAQLALVTAELVSMARADLGLASISSRDAYRPLFGRVNGLAFDEVPALDTSMVRKQFNDGPTE